MAVTISLATLIANVRERGEIRSAYVSDATLTIWINSSLADLWTLITDINPDWLMKDTPEAITVVAGTGTYSLPDDFYLARGIDVLDGAQWRQIHVASHGERNRLQSASSTKLGTKYMITGSLIRFFPTPGWSGSARLWYVPTPTVMAVATQDTQAVDWDTIAGFDEWVICSVLIKHAAKEESDPTTFAAQLGAAEQRIRQVVQLRDMSEPPRVRDIEAEDWEEGFNPSYWRP